MVQLVKHDLEFILKQIKIAEAHTAAIDGIQGEKTPEKIGDALREQVDNPLLPYGLRTVDGAYNNLIPGHEWSGSADQIMPRLLNPKYVIGDRAPPGSSGPGVPVSADPTRYEDIGDVWDADPRIISNLISDQSLDNPAIRALIQQGKAHYTYGTTTKVQAEDLEVVSGFYEEAVPGAGGDAVIRLPSGQSGAVRIDVDVEGTTPVYHDIKIGYLDENDDAVSFELWVDGVRVGTKMLNEATPGNGAQIENLRTHTFENVKVGPNSVVELRSTATNLEFSRLDYVEVTPKSVMIDNVSPDLGDTAPFNGFFTLFGQFFDHGLDMVSKGDNGTVYIPLQQDDPLYDHTPGARTNFMVLTRATPVVGAGADGIEGNEDDVLLGHRNETTPWIDLNQVYTSNPSHQVFLREYVLVDGKPMATGRMLEGRNGGPATWADVKEQAATKLGIILSDVDVLRVPAVLTDLYGEFVRGANGFPQLVMQEGGPTEASLDAPLAASEAHSAGRAFLNDIAHNAVPGSYDNNRDGVADGVKVADGDVIAGNRIIPNMYGNNETYDNELLDRHVIVGDGRGNENIGLTSIHHVFHSEHNRVLEETMKIAIESGDLDFMNEWLLEGRKLTADQLSEAKAELDSLLAAEPVSKAALKEFFDGFGWDGERLFQAARFSTEMVYQHLVFEEFARAVAPDVDPFLFSNTTTVDGSIVAEFAHVVYRFGHSMLTESIDMIKYDADGKPIKTDIGLIEAFLNPLAFGDAGVDPNAAAGAILNGMSRQVGNEIDEFLTGALRNNLVGLPLDLGAVNIARARETGVPTLNEARKQFFADTGDTRVKPYESWYDFALSLKNTASVINFIAAYGTHPSITSATTVEAKRAAATLLVMGGTDAPADRLAFLNATGAWANDTALGGLNDIDFWIGGLAEKKMTFGSMLGSTFTYVFEYQMEQLQAGDRFYYLSRAQGLNLLNELEADSFAQLIMRNTTLGDGKSTHVNGAAFQTADHILEIEEHRQLHEDPVHDDPILGGFGDLVIRRDTDNDGVVDYLRYAGTDHVVLGGSNRGETLIGGEGDDTLWGDGGDDYLEGGYGVDHLHGGDGNDIIVDSGTDIGAADIIHGDAGDDVINPGSGLDLVFGGSGQDFIYGGTEAKDVTGGLGNDFIRGGTGISFLKGNEGDDWIEGGESFDTLAGENSELFFNSTIIGHDVLNGRGNDNDYDAESGDDIMFQNEGIERNNGMAGFDWAIHKGHEEAADSDMTVSIFQNQQNNILRDRFDLVEGLSGWKHSDKLTGRDVVVGAYDANGNATEVEAGAPFESYSNALLQKNLGLIDGLAALVGHLVPVQAIGADGQPVFDKDGSPLMVMMDTTDASDILLGGGGSDTIKGGGGNDVIDGDKWLNVRIRIVKDGVAYTTDDMDGKIYLETDYEKGAPKAGAEAQFNGKTLQQTMFSRELNPGQLSIVREIVDGRATGDVDTAVYTDNAANYTFSANSDGSLRVDHVGFDAANFPNATNPVSDGADTLRNIERVQFLDTTYNVITGTPYNDNGGSGTNDRPRLDGTTGDDIIIGQAGADILNGGNGNDILIGGRGGDSGSYADSFGNGYGGNGGTLTFTGDWTEGGGETGNSPNNGDITISGGRLRFNSSVDGGEYVQRSLNLAGATSATVSFTYEDVGLGAGQNVIVQALNLITGQWENLPDGILGSTTTGSGTFTASLTAAQMGAGSAMRFVTTGDGNNWDNGDSFFVDDFTVNVTGSNLGIDQLNGGAGNDTYAISVGDGNAVIQETSGTDRITVAAAALTGLNAFNTAGDDLVIHFNGQSVTVTDHFATTGEAVETINLEGSTYEGYAFEGDYVLSTDDQGTREAIAGVNTLLAGTTGNNTLVGNTGDDLLFGHDGNDNLDGGLGADLMVGGTGNDTYVVDDADDVVVEAAGGGTDTVQTTLAAYTLGANVENLTYRGGGAFAGTGNDLDNVLTGGAGVDTLDGGAGNDTYVVTGGDVIVEAADGGIDTVVSTGSYVLGANLENLELEGANNTSINGTGNGLANRITGHDGANQLFGGAGNDTINGGGGNDLIDGGTGDDSIDGGSGNDTIIGGDGNDTINLNGFNAGNDVIRYTASNFGNDVINGFDAVGGSINTQDMIDLSGLGVTADNFASRVFETAEGTSTLLTIRENGPSSTVLGTIRINGVAATAIDQSDFILAAAAPTNVITGTNAGQTINGTANGDTINAMGGNDTVNGNGGNDVLNGGEGADILNGGDGNDTMVGGTGSDSGRYFDTFDSGYDGNGGTLDFTGDWIEGGGESGGTNGGAGSGDITISGGRLRFNQTTDGGEFIQRSMNLDGATSATVTFAYQDVNLGAGQNVLVQVLNLATNQWETLTNGILGSTTTGSGTFNASLTANQMGAGSAIRFLAEGDGNNWDNGDSFYINDLAINVTKPGLNAGVDQLNGGNGDDTIIWNANASGATDGRDIVDGGLEGTAGDTFVINGNAEAEVYRIYTRSEAVAAGITGLNANTEIVVTRNGTDNASVIAELREIEEIRINGIDPAGDVTMPNGDSIEIIGDFSGTSLRLNTITIDGNAGDDTVDISALSSAHRIVFRSSGGNDTIVGTLRPQDVIELPEGTVPEDYEITTDESTGVTTMTRDGHSICFTSVGGLPQFGSGDGRDEEEETPPGNGGGDTGSGDDEDGDDNVTNPGHGDDDEEDDGSCSHDEGDDVGTGNNGGGTTPPVTQPDTSLGAPIAGTNATEVLIGTVKGETIMALDGHDNVVAGAGADVVHGGAGNDFLSGEAGRDVMFGGDGDDTMLGGGDADMLYGDAGNDRIFGDDGNDLIDAGAGNDTVYGGAGNDLIVASVGDGNDVYYGDDMAGGSGNDTLDMSAITANITANLGSNGASSGTVTSSQSGSDTIWGIENIVTGSGNDVITASRAVNVIDGGGGNDVFRFLSAADANGDTILGFQPGDRLDLSAIDANTGAAGKQAFTLANGSSFTGPAQLVISHETRDDGEYTVVSGNTTGPDAAEFKISLKGNHDLKASDFVLS
ncbi:peroxidase family protein [Microvirga guangxiensis]|uniref:Ca2+-binding protein, RTX toxin-related n=1 Tax=Microvirga guangxiensis TaxID=549386 RepID=A0A1G5LM40_9HYPH|nr:peroxidase family protein [Microvirga guangxiensis]SCZ13531.1 Ca2+-binding protein, RTX toxin-related [Microvirga guangxiensis]